MTHPHPPVNLALFGLGRWGTHLLRNFLALPQAEVVAVVDPNPQRLSQIRHQFSLPDTVQSYDQWPQALTLAGLDAVVIATPASTHYSLIKAALERGLHVLSEKPMTLEPASSAALCQLAIAQQRQLVVDHTYLFHPAVQRGYDLCQSQTLGELRYAYATRTNLGPVRPDVDAFWDLAIHDVSILNHWLGQLPTQVAAWGQVWLQPEPQAAFPSGRRDGGWVRLTYATGLEATLHVSWLNPDKQRRLGLVGDRGTLVLDEMASSSPLTLIQGGFTPTDGGFSPNPVTHQTIPLPPTEPLEQMGRHFLDCVQHNRPSTLSSGLVATDLVRVMATINRAAETGETLPL
jgi:predicted dehydrogenase